MPLDPPVTFSPPSRTTKEKSAIVSGGGFYKPSIADTSLTWSVVVIFAATSVLSLA